MCFISPVLPLFYFIGVAINHARIRFGRLLQPFLSHGYVPPLRSCSMVVVHLRHWKVLPTGAWVTFVFFVPRWIGHIISSISSSHQYAMGKLPLVDPNGPLNASPRATYGQVEQMPSRRLSDRCTMPLMAYMCWKRITDRDWDRSARLASCGLWRIYLGDFLYSTLSFVIAIKKCPSTHWCRKKHRRPTKTCMD